MMIPSQRQAVMLKAKLFRGFADPSRLSILEALQSEPMTVTEIVCATGLSQSNVSNHLSCLRESGLVETEPRGRYTFYRLNGALVGQLLDLADTLLAQVAQGIYDCTHYSVAEEANGDRANL